MCIRDSKQGGIQNVQPRRQQAGENTHQKAGCLKHSTVYRSSTTASRTERSIRGCNADTEVVGIAHSGATVRDLELPGKLGEFAREVCVSIGTGPEKGRRAVMDSIQSHRQGDHYCHHGQVAGGV